MKKFRRIGVLTSGGDAPGMNACVRAIVRTALANGIEVYGIMEGYKGLVNDNLKLFSKPTDVSNIIERPGTVVYTDRCDEFRTEAGILKAVEVCRKNQIDGVVAIGGDGTFAGATDLSLHGIATIGVPGTIDNDIAATDTTIGFDTAMTTDVQVIDSLRATSESHARCCVIEVMGRHAGDIALNVAVATGAYAVAVPEIPFDENKLVEDMKEARKNGKRSFMIVVSEGLAGYAEALAKTIDAKTGITTRYINPAHIQRGGIPTLNDRILATEMGEYAVTQLLAGNSDIVICKVDNKLCTVDIKKALTCDKLLKGKLTKEQMDAIPKEDKAWMDARCDAVRAEKQRLYDLTYTTR